MNKSEDITKLALAMVKVQAEIENVAKNSDNPFFKSKYADLGTILDLSRPVLSKHGIAIVQLPCSEKGRAGLETMLMHESGQWLSERVMLPIVKETLTKDTVSRDGTLIPGRLKPLSSNEIAQAVGSVVTYLRRYSYAAAISIAQVDDDGNGTSEQRQLSAPPAPKMRKDQEDKLQALMRSNDAIKNSVLAFLQTKNMVFPDLDAGQADNLIMWINNQKWEKKDVV